VSPHFCCLRPKAQKFFQRLINHCNSKWSTTRVELRPTRFSVLSSSSFSSYTRHHYVLINTTDSSINRPVINDAIQLEDCLKSLIGHWLTACDYRPTNCKKIDSKSRARTRRRGFSNRWGQIQFCSVKHDLVTAEQLTLKVLLHPLRDIISLFLQRSPCFRVLSIDRSRSPGMRQMCLTSNQT